MKYLLLLCTYCGTFLYAVRCYRIIPEDGNSKDDGSLYKIVLGTAEQPSLSRQPRQSRFSSSNEDNDFWGNFQPNSGGFNWGSNQNNYEREARPSRQNTIVFEDNFDEEFQPPNFIPVTQPTARPPPPSSTVAIPGMATTRSTCEVNCPATSQFDPVCGDNNVTYTNIRWLQCAQRCGKNVNVKYIGSCPRVP